MNTAVPSGAPLASGEENLYKQPNNLIAYPLLFPIPLAPAMAMPPLMGECLLSTPNKKIISTVILEPLPSISCFPICLL